jgi:hypothetical protein
MLSFRKKLAAAALTGVAAVGVMAGPAFADSASCQGPCTTRPVWRNSTSYTILVNIESTSSLPRWCYWEVRDYDNNQVVRSGSMNPLEVIDSALLSRVYNRYVLKINSSGCRGTISN